MSRALYFFVNILIFWVVVTAVDGLTPGTFGFVTALVLGGVLFALLAIAAEPLLSFFKFPTNFWGLLVVGFLLNLGLFAFFSTKVLYPILKVTSGSFGGGLSPIPFPVLTLGSTILVAATGAILATLLQILTRFLGK